MIWRHSLSARLCKEEIMTRCLRRLAWLLGTLAIGMVVGNSPTGAADLAVLSESTWDEFAPQGKEVDAIYGDFVLRNDQIVAVIAQPLATRNANMTVRNVGGAIIDLTSRARPNDQLSAYYPGASKYSLHGPQRITARID